MAKNLKVNIKNAQLAQVLKATKAKPEAPKKKAEEPPAVKAVVEPIKEVLPPEVPVKAVAPPPVEEKPKEQIETTPSIKPRRPIHVAPPIKRPKPSKHQEVPIPEVSPDEPILISAEDREQAATEPSVKRQSFSRVVDVRTTATPQGSGEDANWRRRRARFRQKGDRRQEPVAATPSSLSIKLPLTVKDLAAQMKVKAAQIISYLFLQGIPVTINHLLVDPTVVELIGHEFGCAIHIDTSKEERLRVTEETTEEEITATPQAQLMQRPPVVTVMGHVDHGKTSIIDAFRKSNLTQDEAGAITQHIGAFSCHTKHGNFTVLDTPGHEAFSAIRARGASVTDIVVLVIAGDEGIKPQTDEAIAQAKEADVPIIVAINKSDKPNFNPETIYRELADRSLLPEAWGGEIITVNCSAKTGEGIDALAEMIALQSEVLELRADPHRRARGTVLESELHTGMGATATLLVQNGTLHITDALVFGFAYGRVKTLQDEHGKKVDKALPGTAVRVAGLSEVVEAGSDFIVVGSEKEAKQIISERLAQRQQTHLRQTGAKDIHLLLQKKAEDQSKKTLNLILKADVQGSLEALLTTLRKIPQDKVLVNFVSTGIGQISESDAELAEASDAVIIGFHTNVESHADPMIKRKKVVVRLHDVIYHLVDDVKELMTERLDKIREEKQVGTANVLTTFKSSQLGTIAGCQVADGIIKRSHLVKLVRGGKILWEGSLASIKRHKDDVREVTKGLECGLLLERFQDIQPGDQIQSFEITYRAQTL